MQGREQGVLVDDGGPRGVDQIGGGAHPGEFGGTDQAPGAVAQRQVYGDEVGALQQLFLRPGERGADLPRPFLGEVLAPGDHLHAEGPAHLRDPAADLAQAQQAERPAVQVGAEGGLPGAVPAQAVRLGDDRAGEAEEQGPGEFDRRGGGAGRPADGDAVALGGGEVDHRVAHAGGDQQPEPGQPSERLRRERDPLAQGDDDVELREGVGHFVHRSQVSGEGDDVHVGGDGRPVGDGGGGGLEVLDHGAAQLHEGLSGRSGRADALHDPPERPTPAGRPSSTPRPPADRRRARGSRRGGGCGCRPSPGVRRPRGRRAPAPGR